MLIPRLGRAPGPAEHRFAGLGASGLRAISRRVGAVLLVGLAACGGDDGAASAPLTAPPIGPTVTRTVVTLDLDTVTDCTTLAGSLTPVFDSLGDLSGEDAGRLDPAVIEQIGTYLEAVEVRRHALSCEQGAWIAASCAAMAAADSPMAAQFLTTRCTAGPSPGPSDTVAAVDGSSPATATRPTG